jgi:hypothetical protein
MYRVEPIGAAFGGKKGHQVLADRLSQLESEGWELVQVFPVTVTGCLGLSKQQTNYAVLRRRESAPVTSGTTPAARAETQPGT